MSLFLKYRPQTFSDLVGQTSVRKTLQNALKSEKPAHAYLFTGSRGTGKTSTARIFAKGLNCQNLKDGDPCGACDFCTGTANGTLVDVIEIDAASNRGIDEIRDLRDKINFAPNIAKRKVYIIDEVHMLTKEAFNALLKTLEEPPDHAFFCLATTELHKVPETIISRCQVFSFQRFMLEQLVERLEYICAEEKITYDKTSLELIARKAEGGLRDAISSLEQTAAECESKLTEAQVRSSLGISNSETLENFYKSLAGNQTQEGLDILNHIATQGQDFRTFGHDFLGFLREKMFQCLNTDEVHYVIKCIEEIEKALGRLKVSPIVELPLEIAVINLTRNENPIAASPIKKQTPKISSAPAPAPAPSDDGFVFDDVKNNTSSASAAPTPAPVSTPEAPQTIGHAQSANLKSLMDSMAEKSGIPIFAKKSFLTTNPEETENRVIFYTDSDFHLEKLNEVSTKLALKKALNELTGKTQEIEFQKKSGAGSIPTTSSKLTPVQNNTPSTDPKQTATVDDFLSF